jgi:regulator of sirC expression with transglutaminase-like and TPR domain
LRLPAEIRRRLVRVGETADRDIDLADAALTLAAADRPGVAFEPYTRHLERLVAEVRAYVGGKEPAPDLDLRIEALAQVIVKRYGYGGTEAVFDDLEAANLMRVIDSRSGLPIVIGILFIHVCRKMGWPIVGLDFPGRFLVRMDGEGERRIIDVFDGGRVIGPQDMRGMFKAIAGNHVELKPEHYREMGNRDLLMRLQNNIKARLLRGGRLYDALEVIEAMLLFAPARPELWREAGLIYARVDRVKDAVAALEEYMRQSGGDSARYNTSILLQELRTRLN